MNLAHRPLAFYLRLLLLPLIVAVPMLQSTEFASLGNLAAIVQTFAVIAPLALGIGLTMIAGEFDLSAGAMVAVGGLVMVMAGADHPALGLLAALAAGAFVGLSNAYLTLKLNISSLVVTLGVMIVLQGASVWLEGGQTATFDHIELTDFVGRTVLGILSPWSLCTLALGGFTALLLGSTRLGRDIHAAGSHRKAALMSGARVRASIFAVFILSGTFAAFNGAVMAVSLGRASSQFGAGLLIQAITAAILGGVALSGGVGKAAAILFGALTLAVLGNGLSFVGADSSTILLTNGGVLLLVVLVESDVLDRVFGTAGRNIQHEARSNERELSCRRRGLSR